MTASKDPIPSRPLSQHRLSMGSNGSGFSSRPSLSRAHAHSVSLGSINSHHRVNRRKSSSSVAVVNMAALAAAAKEASQDSSTREKPIAEVDALGITAEEPHTSMAQSAGSGKLDQAHISALVDGPSLASMVKGSAKARARRASEGSRLAKTERPRSNAGELRCETCGKGYKHGSCLTKHLWEHTPEWALTSKLLISKHQQVQLLEAASVLVAMNQDGPVAVPPPNAVESDLSSDSPAFSGSSEAVDEDELSSRTSTPSQQEDGEFGKSKAFRQPTRQDSYSSVYSRSYQSTSGTSFAASSVPNDSSGFSHLRQWSSSTRPSTAGGALGNDEHADLAAAAEGLLSCSLSTPIHGPTQMPVDIPPVPPLPAQYSKQHELHSSGFSAVRQTLSSPQALPQYVQAYSSDVEMDAYSPAYSRQDEDDGVFGKMDQ